MRTIMCTSLTARPEAEVVYRLLPRLFDETFYAARTNRNIGWITPKEQELLRGAVVGIAGCGGMGGLVAVTLMRLGVGELRIADTEAFDVSNLNRQYGATRETIGKSKAFETARMLRIISDDTTVVVYPQGITEKTVEHFTAGCSIVCDEIEFWAIASRILLHKTMRAKPGIILTSPTVGHRVYVTKFTADSMTIEEALGMTYQEAVVLQKHLTKGTASADELARVMKAMTRFAAPELPEYATDLTQYSTVKAVTDRLSQGVASIIATNPPMAAGFLANQVIFHILEERSAIKRKYVLPPVMPGYAMFDAALLIAKRFEGQWW